MLTLLALAAIIGGIAIMLDLPYGFLEQRIGEAALGVILLAGGLTYFWRHSRFYRE